MDSLVGGFTVIEARNLVEDMRASISVRPWSPSQKITSNGDGKNKRKFINYVL